MTALRRPLRHAFPLLGLALLSAGVLACKAKPAADSGFLAHPEMMSEQRDLYPLHRVWFSPGWDSERYTTIVVRPVNTDYVEQASMWDKTTLKGGRLEEDLADLAAFTENAFREAISADEQHRFTLVDTADKSSLILEIALVEVVPNKAELGALGLAATVVAAPVGAGIAAKETAKGVVAIEARVTHAATGEIVAMFVDREAGKFGPINLRRATWYGHAHKIIEEWADQFVEIVNAPPGEKVEDTATFTLLPW